MHAAALGNSIKIDAEHMNCSSSTDAYLNTAHLTKKTTILQNNRTILKGRGLRLIIQEDKGTKRHLQIKGHSKGNHTCMIDYSNCLYRTKEQLNQHATYNLSYYRTEQQRKGSIPYNKMLTSAKHVVTYLYSMTTDAIYKECKSDWSHQVSVLAPTRWLQGDQILPLSVKEVTCERTVTQSVRTLNYGKYAHHMGNFESRLLVYIITDSSNRQNHIPE